VAALSLIAILVGLLFVGGTEPAPAHAEDSVAAEAARCLPNDPHKLDDFLTVIGSDSPPRGPQTISPGLIVELLPAKGVLRQPPRAISPPPDEGGTADPAPTEPAVDDAPFRQMQFTVFNSRTLNQFLVTLNQDMLNDIRACHEDKGWTSATDGFATLEDAETLGNLFLPIVLREGAQPFADGSGVSVIDVVSPLGWSNGVDTRIVRTPTTVWPWRTISQFTYGNNSDSGCTGTLIGPRHLVTAAHCINEKGTNNWYTVRVTPARNGINVRPYNDSVISPNPAPGTEAWYFTPAAWRNPATATPTQWDWGLIVIPNRLGDQTGWMGYVARPGSALKQVSNLNRGYPQCGTDRGNAPAGCQIARMYGDTANCNIGDFYNPGPDGWNRRFSVSCDLSAGHSGSPVYHYFFDSQLAKWVPVVTAVVITESCTTCGPSDSYPNRARRITPGDLGTISWLRETFP
jgi:V8-like Glu-specific endopeptidase